MRITIFTHGTRGDIWPHVALASQLVARDRDVTLAVPGELCAFAESAGARTVALPFDFGAWGESPAGQDALRRGGLTFLRRLMAEVGRYASELDEAFERAATGAEALVS